MVRLEAPEVIESDYVLFFLIEQVIFECRITSTFNIQVEKKIIICEKKKKKKQTNMIIRKN